MSTANEILNEMVERMVVERTKDLSDTLDIAKGEIARLKREAERSSREHYAQHIRDTAKFERLQEFAKSCGVPLSGIDYQKKVEEDPNAL